MALVLMAKFFFFLFQVPFSRSSPIPSALLTSGADQTPTRPTPSPIPLKDEPYPVESPTVEELHGRLADAEIEIEVLKIGLNQAEVSLILPSLYLQVIHCMLRFLFLGEDRFTRVHVERTRIVSDYFLVM